ncbi:MAG: pro-sigmaK processing inhibitor BofA family protein [Oscillospiraceae bacterium]|nr:pro-sigmaK processing inhibitor BofA family protein [Oscillospiraceae bacterium]
MLYLLLMVAAAVALIALFIRIIRLPLKLIVKVLLHAAAGFVALFVLNFLGSWVGIYIEMNWINSLITGLLGVPGVLLLLLIKYVL